MSKICSTLKFFYPQTVSINPEQAQTKNHFVGEKQKQDFKLGKNKNYQHFTLGKTSQ